MSLIDKLKGGMSLEDFQEEVEEAKEEGKKEKKAAKKPKAKKKKTTTTVEVKEEKAPKESTPAKKEEEWSGVEGELAVDVYQTDKDIVIQTAVAGVKPDEIDVSIEDDIVTIRGERKEIAETEEKDYYFQECFWGSFSRQVMLPEEVDVNKMQASFQDNVLTLRMPKLARKKARKIKVSS